MKRRLLIGFISLFVILGIGSTSWALNSVAGTSDLGSLLVWPKVVVDYDVDTVITITNTANSPGSIALKCYWVWNECTQYNCVDWDESGKICEEYGDTCIAWDCANTDFIIDVTHNQPIWFSAKSGEGTVNVSPFPAYEGELKCFVVDSSNVAIRFNRLKGHANIFMYDKKAAAKYNAWVFQARAVAEGARMGLNVTDDEDPSVKHRMLELTGKASLANGAGWYFACPKYLHFNFFATRGNKYADANEVEGFAVDHGEDHVGIIYNDIAIVPCKQDLTNGGPPTVTKLEMDVWNEDETKFTGAWDCLDCFYERKMEDINDNFTIWFLKAQAAHARIWSVKNSVCDTPAAAASQTGLLGVHLEKWYFGHHYRSGEVIDHHSYGLTATTPIPQSRITTDFILYTPNP